MPYNRPDSIVEQASSLLGFRRDGFCLFGHDDKYTVILSGAAFEAVESKDPPKFGEKRK